ncbi:MAG TPA: YidC/Oxa1 family membrane protein insertase [Candidatus Paceibacterota bacterium]|nr:YidC/Oxa1 family membrane protein insertase [Candidatus Paceibacterota bacterium]
MYNRAMQSLWNTVFYQPIYNALIFIIDNITFGDVGFAIILLTIVVKLALSPLTKRSIKSQILMKRMEPEIKQIKKDYPNKEEQAKKTFELYKKYGTNPFSGCLVVILQLPVIFALYYVFYNGITIKEGLIYSFIQIPAFLQTNFLGLVEMSSKSIFLGVFAGVTQFIQGYLSSPVKSKKLEVVKEKDSQEAPTFQDQLSSSMQMNVRYILPVFIAFVAWKISAAVALYWIVSNIFTIVQEWVIRRKLTHNVI